jgi:hypothetical protein
MSNSDSTLIDNATFLKGIREDGTVEGYPVETYYRPCEGIGDDDGFLRVQIDDDATDIETRIPHSALIAAGWAKERVGTYRAMAEEYMELMAHMDAGGDYMEFMAKRQHKDAK